MWKRMSRVDHGLSLDVFHSVFVVEDVVQCQKVVRTHRLTIMGKGRDNRDGILEQEGSLGRKGRHRVKPELRKMETR